MKQPRDMTEKQFEAAVARGGFKPVGSAVQGAWWLLAEEFTKGASE